MFDIGIWEFGVIGVVALVVLGPERLPKVARTAGHLFGRLQRYVANVKADINREMDMSEFAKVKEEVQSAARAFEQSVQDHAKSIDSESRAISALADDINGNVTTTTTTAASANVTAPATNIISESQADMLIAQQAGIPTLPTIHTTAESSETNETPVIAQTTPQSTMPTATHASAREVLQSFDLGIEPPRRIARSQP